MNKNYWIIPLTVGLDNNLKPLDKLIYAQILSLSKNKGYCYATNNYFAKLNNYLTKRTIINSLKTLKMYNYIKIEIDNIEINNSKRKIYITDEEVLKKYSLSIENKDNTSSEKNYNQNIINYNNKINNKGPIICYDSDDVMLWNGKRCESEEATLEEMEELELLLSEFKGGSNE